ncbi:hypothetical protein GMOD_00000835 [Pyrenophora seminiperda CCB06]|uniref:Uncharacterized protein n=1 Tax=Pyrenophora seminiperda CCB06 TaxID=1302712 RepID=A0A3M7M8H8_9PLEO|nr:hypothetical protein GMOD_00000835 [Pyrenophora seminiperda CCB06]
MMDPLTPAAAAATTTPPAALTNSLPERLLRAPRETALPNLRGENETELRYLIDLIESQSWILSPLSPPTCILGRHPPPKDTSSSSHHLTNKHPPPPANANANAFCASLYSLGKAGARTLELGPEVGGSRKQVLERLLGECGVGGGEVDAE